jgi:4-aminobutyrate aminotransferase-like enzyme
MLGVKRDQLKALVVNSAKSQIDSTKQSIQNDGLTKAIFRVTDKKSSGLQTLSVQSTVSTGAEVNEDALKAEVAGKKKGEVQLIVGNRPGVKEVDVDYSPFWVYKTPKNPKKITFVFEQTGNASN